jgi:hypothetical protein
MWMLHGMGRSQDVLPAESGVTPQHCGDLCLWLSASDPVTAKHPSSETLQSFMRTAQHLAQLPAFLPARYGILHTKDAFGEAVASHSTTWLQRLEAVQQCDEFSLRLLLPPEELVSAQTTKPRTGTEYLRRRKNAPLEIWRKKLLAKYAECARETRWESRREEGRWLLTLHLLVPRHQADRLQQVHSQSRAEWNLPDLLSGPWPVFHFVFDAERELSALAGELGKIWGSTMV